MWEPVWPTTGLYTQVLPLSCQGSSGTLGVNADGGCGEQWKACV